LLVVFFLHAHSWLISLGPVSDFVVMFKDPNLF
jgi:hypothetical protein